MRIIAGEFRGRRLLPPEGDVTRPITDRAKQSLFDILAPRMPDAVVYDVFAGTGSMGLESLSRGASRAIFFEADRSAVARLRKNLAALGISRERFGIESHDLFKVFNAWDAVPTKEVVPADIVFLDPPYRFLRERPDDLRRLARQLAGQWMEPDAVVVFRHDANDTLELPPLREVDRREYGGMVIELLSPNAEPS